MIEIFRRLLGSYTTREVTDVLDLLLDSHEIDWKPVGERRNNLSTINIGTDPAAGLAERITNAIDAVLELEWVKNNKPTHLTSPREAAEVWFGIENGRLGDVDKVGKALQSLSKNISVAIHESERDAYPTVEVRDYGIGLDGKKFGDTILSLNGSNKLDKLFLMGAYGQGGSTAFSYNNFTVIVSKPYSSTGNDNAPISWTIVRLNHGDVHRDKHEWYEYLVDRKTQLPFEVSNLKSAFKHGTLIRHIGMDLGRYSAAMTQPTGSLWYLAHHYLFDPILPFTIVDERSRKTKSDTAVSRGVYGNNRRLTRGGGDEKHLVDYSQSMQLTFRDGTVTIYYWVLSLEGDKPWERIRNYTLPSQPIIITFNGQKQGFLPSSIIKEALKLPFLSKYLVVQIECDELDNESKRQLFSSTRESLRETSIHGELRKLLVDTLGEDDRLRLLDKESKQRYLKSEDTVAVDRLRKRLATRINQFIEDNGKGKSVSANSTRDSIVPKKNIPIEPVDPPTFIEILGPDNRAVGIGKTFGVRFRTDALPNYFSNPDWFVAVIDPHSFGSYTGSARVVDGYGIAYFKSREDLAPGVDGNVTLEVRPPRTKSISSTQSITSVLPPEDSEKKKKGDKGVPNIEVIAVTERDEYFRENGWDHETVGELNESSEGVIIYLNESNKKFGKLIERAQQYGPTVVDSVKNKYKEHMGFCVFLTFNDSKQILATLDKEFGTVGEEQLDYVRKQDLKNSCETICGMISDFFEFIRAEQVEEIDGN